MKYAQPPSLMGIPEGVCEDDVLAHKQRFRTLISPEHRKMCVHQLVDAIRSLQRTESAHLRQQRRMDLRWIFFEDFDFPFSFENVCMAINIDPQACRERLRPLVRGGSVDKKMLKGLKQLERELRYARGNVGVDKCVDGNRHYSHRKKSRQKVEKAA